VNLAGTPVPWEVLRLLAIHNLRGRDVPVSRHAPHDPLTAGAVPLRHRSAYRPPDLQTGRAVVPSNTLDRVCGIPQP